ncbi:MAG: AFG1/ZapE family ATPase, partial [Proteobacteria bacterium]|nr:AFG1/ZapE family ATPase [Pseudomonadota bacterium]
LVDTLYDAKIKLICSAQSQPNKLYKKGKGSFEFERTISRLIEMQSIDWVKP